MGIPGAVRLALLAFKALPKGFKALSWMGLGAAALEAAQTVSGKEAPDPAMPEQALDELRKSFQTAGMDVHGSVQNLTEEQVGLMLNFFRTNPLVNLLFRGTLGDDNARTFVSYIEQELLQKLGEIVQVREEELVERAGLRIRQLTGWKLRDIVEIVENLKILLEADTEDLSRLRSALIR